jgi:hypothetical protein
MVCGRNPRRSPEAHPPRRLVQHDRPDVPERGAGVWQAVEPVQLYRVSYCSGRAVALAEQAIRALHFMQGSLISLIRGASAPRSHRPDATCRPTAVANLTNRRGQSRKVLTVSSRPDSVLSRNGNGSTLRASSSIPISGYWDKESDELRKGTSLNMEGPWATEVAFPWKLVRCLWGDLVDEDYTGDSKPSLRRFKGPG